MYTKTLVNLFGKFVGSNAFWLPVFRSTRTFTPVTCPWATWYFLWSMNRLTNRKIYAFCWGNSACMLPCWSYADLLLHRYGCESLVFLLERTAKWHLSLLLLPSHLSSQSSAISFRKLKWCLQEHLYVSMWKTSVLPSKWTFFCLFCLLRDMWVLSSRIWIPWWKAA